MQLLALYIRYHLCSRFKDESIVKFEILLGKADPNAPAAKVQFVRIYEVGAKCSESLLSALFALSKSVAAIIPSPVVVL